MILRVKDSVGHQQSGLVKRATCDQRIAHRRLGEVGVVLRNVRVDVNHLAVAFLSGDWSTPSCRA